MARPYLAQLALNIMEAHKELSVSVGNGHIYIRKQGAEPDLKKWLFSMLEELPEINHPIETVHFAVYVDDALKLVTLINPSEFDARAADLAKEQGLRFSQPSAFGAPVNQPLPLDHPYQTDRNYFRKKYKGTKYLIDGKLITRD